MRSLFMLLIVGLLSLTCSGAEFPHNGDCFTLHNFSSFNSPNLEHVPGLPSRYINDLGHEFPVEGWVAGSYWAGGAYGSKNGFSDYYGNTHWNLPRHYYFQQVPYTPIPEPMTIALLGLGSLFVLGTGMRGRKV